MTKKTYTKSHFVVNENLRGISSYTCNKYPQYDKKKEKNITPRAISSSMKICEESQVTHATNTHNTMMIKKKLHEEPFRRQ